MVRRDLTRHKGKREFRRRNEQKKKKKSGNCGEGIACSQWVFQSGCVHWDLLCGGRRRAKRGDAALPVVVLQLGRGRQRVGHLLHLVVGRLGFGFLFAERLLEGAAQLQGGVKKTKKQKTNTPWVNISGLYITARSGDITSCQIGRLRRALSKQSPLAGLSKEAGKKAGCK